jgi:hypothetical protein
LANTRRLETSGECGNYLALSYCWGKSKRLWTTANWYKEFQNHLPIDEMPATFKVAYQVAQRIGYQYIWIDALCIIQDDCADVEKEISTMGNIY